MFKGRKKRVWRTRKCIHFRAKYAWMDTFRDIPFLYFTQTRANYVFSTCFYMWFYIWIAHILYPWKTRILYVISRSFIRDFIHGFIRV